MTNLKEHRELTGWRSLGLSSFLFWVADMHFGYVVLLACAILGTVAFGSAVFFFVSSLFTRDEDRSAA